MGCKCCWGHAGFASLNDRFDPDTVHHIIARLAQFGSSTALTKQMSLVRPQHRVPSLLRMSQQGDGTRLLIGDS